MSNDLSNQTWLITGSSTGFGKEIAREVLARGGNVVATARDPASVSDLATLAPDRVLATRLDVTKQSEIDDSIAAAIDRFGAIDVLVNNAGYGFVSGIEEGSDAEMRHQFDVNVFGLVAVTRAALPHMRAKGSGWVVNLSSTAGSRGSPGAGYYCASKWAVEALSEALSGELAEFGLKVLIVAPGPFRTEFAGRSISGPKDPIPAYTVAAGMRAATDAMNETQAGDPVRAARIIVDTVTGGDAPMRLMLGGAAQQSATQSVRDRLADMERSAKVAAEADFPS